MTWKHFFTSSIGKKLIMGLTGLFLISFLVVHCFINSMIFFDDGGQTFNHWGHFMGSNLIVRTMELGLFAGLIIHIIQGLILWAQNRSARPVKYAKYDQSGSSTWYSRSMGLLGTLLLMFLVLHLYHFWVPSRLGGMANVKVLDPVILSDYADEEAHNLYKAMIDVFQNVWVVIIYVAGVLSLCWHLIHGFQSAFQTFGINHKKYTPLIKVVGVAFSVIICLLFAMMPISIYLKWIE
ncbi:MAG TPA: succinate dehydrogenase cytochrome b subunit [Ferruginibacter sp.]|nr:succinate dehydrogenase cytochrome b subunit [Ferruginibacter sp.]